MASGCTMVMCRASGCRTALHGLLVAELRRVVRATDHGVLVVARCTLGDLACRLRAPGPLVAVQPCDTDRRPLGPIIRAGPLRSADDVADLVAWLRAGQYDRHELPRHLLATHRTMGAAASN